MNKQLKNSFVTRLIINVRCCVKYLAITPVCLSLISCAPVYQLSPSAIALRNRMTTEKAAIVLGRYIKPDHACTLNYLVVPIETTLDMSVPLSVSGTTVTLFVRYGVAVDSHISGNVMAGTGRITTSYKERHGTYAIDMKTIDRAIVHRREQKSPFPIGCGAMDPGYLVAFRSKTTALPGSEFAVNVPTAEDLDSLMAAVTYLSPAINMLK